MNEVKLQVRGYDPATREILVGLTEVNEVFNELNGRIVKMKPLWVSVKDKLPNGYCIAFRPKAHSGTQVATVFYDQKMKKWSGNFKVTHWMKIPELPTVNTATFK